MISLTQFRKAADALKGRVIRTPLIHSPILSRLLRLDIYLKLENLQKTGSFKIRGATYKLGICHDRIGPAGVVAASAGNHAQGVALAAKEAGVPATIIMPKWASISKQTATSGYDGKVILHGNTIGESLEKARQLSGEGMTFIHPFDDPDVIAGQGTIALEVLSDLPDADVLVVPIGGGGLISGIAAAAKSIRPGISIIGVQAAVCPSAAVSLREGKITSVASTSSIADGISVKKPGETTFEMIRELVDDIVLVEEEQIAAAILMLLERKKILAEGSGAATLAALLKGSVQIPEGSKVVLVISGGNVDTPLLGRILSKGLIENGRIMRVRVQLDDVPGSLARLLSLVADLKANVLHIYHERYVRDTPLFFTRVELEVETRGLDHVDEVMKSLREAGYVMEGYGPTAPDNYEQS